MNLEPQKLNNLDNLEKLLIPAKTFLVGEYAALIGGSSLCIATRPYFTFKYKSSNSVDTLHENSAASQYLAQHKLKSDFKLVDSFYYKGLGLSTAEFIASWIQVYQQKSNETVHLKDIYRDYLKVYSDVHSSLKPSGVDLLTQLCGKITSVTKHNDYDDLNFEIATYDWPFKNIGFFILSTGYKENTHLHLETLDRSTLKDLLPLSNCVVAAFHSNDWSSFLNEMKNWTQALIAKGLTCDSSLRLKSALEKNSFVLLAKPCGARGADTILVFFYKKNEHQVQDYINSLQLSIIASENDLAPGVLS